jgi:protein involved in polysaccharide export with SLBB domain
MRVSDLIFQAGALSQSAYPVRVELARMKDDGSREVFYASLDEPEGNLTLQRNDKLFVRQIPGWEERDIVTIEGEVTFPGKYVITDDMSSLYSLIQRAGGLTADAFATGTVFKRASLVEDMKRRGVDRLINRSAELTRDDSGRIVIDSSSIVRDNVMSNRIIVNVKELLINNNLSHDLELIDGDHVYIPSKPAGVQVLGAVPSISTITYRPNQRAKYYLERAGGFLLNADEGSMQLIRADGTISSGSGVVRQKIQLGDAIFVPTKVKRDRDWLRIFSATASVAASIATTIFVIDRL